MRIHISTCFLSLVCLTSSALGQFREAPEAAVEVGRDQTSRWQAGVSVSASSGPVRGIFATVPVPIEWPEQSVKVVEENVAPEAKVSFHDVGDTARLMVIQIPAIAYGRTADVLMTFEVVRRSLSPPEDTSVYQLPDRRKLDRQMLTYLGISPMIANRDTRTRSMAREAIAEHEDSAWEAVEAIYDLVRETVEYKESADVKGSVRALRDGTGNHEDMTCLFIAMCRSVNIPARTVWVHQHCYPEFYLLDAEGEGHWFPCEAAGTRSFGGIDEHRVILFKGDLYRPPHNPREMKRFPAEYLKGAGGKPRVKFHRKPVS